MSEKEQKVAIVTRGSQGLVAGYRQQGRAVVANALTITPSEDPAVLAVEGDVAEPATADRIISEALARFGRIDTLVNNAGVFISQPFTGYTAEAARRRISRPGHRLPRGVTVRRHRLRCLRLPDARPLRRRGDRVTARPFAHGDTFYCSIAPPNQAAFSPLSPLAVSLLLKP